MKFLENLNRMKIIIESFDSFLINHYNIFESSTFSKIGVPSKMVSAIYTKEENRDDYYNIGKIYIASKPKIMPYTYNIPKHDVNIKKEFKFFGKRIESEDSQRKSKYTDFAEYLINLPLGQIRVLLTSPEDEFYMYLYYKKERAGGEQYAIIIWDKDAKEAIDYQFHGLVIDASNKKLIRSVHNYKGGNTNQKIQEIVKNLTEGPSNKKPLTVYEFEFEDIKESPRELRKKRKNIIANENFLSINFIELFAYRYSNIFKKLKNNNKLNFLISQINLSRPFRNDFNITPSIKNLANILNIDEYKLLEYLYDMLIEFRKDIYIAGAGGNVELQSSYDLEDPYELEKEQKYKYEKRLVRRDYVKRVDNPEYFGNNKNDPNNLKTIPKTNNVASIQSLIKNHTLDGALHRFLWYVLTGKITRPSVNILSAFGVKASDDINKEELGDFGNWII